MYQGKFNSNNKQGNAELYEIIAQRNAARNTQPAPQKKPASQNPPQDPSMRMGKAPQDEEIQARKARQAKKPQEAPKIQEAPKRRGPRLGGVIFYTFYFLFIFLFFGATYLGLNWLQGWLVDFEAAQPTTKCEEVFHALFDDPDWAALYDAAGVESTQYEGKDVFVAYMENKVGEQELTYMETSAGLSGDKKYIVKLDDEKIASFTLEGEAKGMTDIPNWQLGTVELFYQRNESYRIQKMDEHTAYVNGVALTEEHTIQIASTVADEYLPMGVTSARTSVQMVTGLMGLPTVTVKDPEGNEMPVSYDPETRTFTEQTVANTIGEEERNAALEAAKTYALYMIEKSSAKEVAKYFDSTTDTYKTIVKSEIWWTQANNGAKFSDEKVSGYARYTDDLFSVRVSMSLNVTRTDGTIKTFPVDTTLFFKQTGGKWKCFLMTNVDVTKPVGQVRLTFMDGGEVLTTGFVNTDATEINTPMISAPEGKRFAGWALESVDANGVKTLTIMFGPSESGLVSLPSGTILEPMVLYAYFEDIEEA